MRLAAQAKGGYYPTPERVVDLIAELIHTPTGYYHRGRETIRILDPCCGAGDALERLAERLDRPNALSIETYGVELHRDRAEEAERRLHRTLASDLFATSIANGAFGLLLLNPPYDFDSEDKRTERLKWASNEVDGCKSVWNQQGAGIPKLNSLEALGFV